MANFSRLITPIILALTFAAGDIDSAHAQSARKNEKPAKELPPPEPPVIQVPQGQQTKAVQVQKIVVRIPSNKAIGEIQGGLFCVKRDDFRLRGGTFNLDDPAYGDRFRSELQAAGYNLVGSATALFDDRDSGKAELLIGGLIADIKADICIQKSAILDQSGGEAEMRVDWQVYNGLTRKVIFEKQTRGKSKIKMHKGGEDEVLVEAFASAARLLLTDRSFFELFMSGSVGAEVPASSSQVNVASVLIAKIPLSQKRFQDHANDIRGNVATIFTSGGTGSGFFVSDRHIITNAHVVGGAKFVKVKLITGREILGDVVTTDAARDVALVQTEAGGFPGLPIRTDELEIGSSVFAVGSPLGEKNEGTVSAGVVSSYRTQDGQRLIQSDVNVTHGNSGGPLLDEKGNIIGLTVSGQTDPNTGGGTGLNFFIPITDAMTRLGLQFR